VNFDRCTAFRQANAALVATWPNGTMRHSAVRYTRGLNGFDRQPPPVTFTHGWSQQRVTPTLCDPDVICWLLPVEVATEGQLAGIDDYPRKRNRLGEMPMTSTNVSPCYGAPNLAAHIPAGRATPDKKHSIPDYGRGSR
jgi:hypothetical protein